MSTQRVVIFDTTLRDGEQCPGASLNTRQKIEIARQLARLKVDVIEAGFPVASKGDFEAVRAVARDVRGVSVAGLARCVPGDIECAWEALRHAERPRIHVFLATSEIHRRHKLHKAKEEVLRQAVWGVRKAAALCPDVEFSPEDASRTEPEFLARVVEAVIRAGARTVNIPDTVGYAVPDQFGALIAHLFGHVDGIERAVISVHCHNDLGLAVANSLAALRQGARGVECTINGLGERAGNAALEEIVMALRTRRDVYRLATGVDARQLCKTSKLVSHLTGMPVQRNKAIVGENAFAHEAGIHQDGILKERTTYEIMRPETVGWGSTELVLGKHSGRHAFGSRMKLLGFRMSARELERAFERFKDLTDKKKRVYDEDLVTLADAELLSAPQAYALEYIHVTSGNRMIPTATVRLVKDKQTFQDASSGDGPVDAALKTIDRITGLKCRLADFSVRAVTSGKDAMGEVTLHVQIGDDLIAGKGAGTDIVEAAARAYLGCINRHVGEPKAAARAAPGKKRAPAAR